MPLTQFRWFRRFIPACDAWIIVAEDVDTGVVWFPIRGVCLLLHVDSPSQIEAIKSNWRIAPGLNLIPIPTEQRTDGTWARAQQTQCLPYDEFCWWMGNVDPRNGTPLVREKLLLRQRALMALASEIMRRDDSGVASLQRRLEYDQAAADPEVQVMASGELHMQCPVCHSPLCVVIAGAHVVPGAEVE